VGKIVRLCAYKPKGNRNKHTAFKERNKEKPKEIDKNQPTYQASDLD
jgi:hypothetical protein